MTVVLFKLQASARFTEIRFTVWFVNHIETSITGIVPGWWKSWIFQNKIKTEQFNEKTYIWDIHCEMKCYLFYKNSIMITI